MAFYLLLSFSLKAFILNHLPLEALMEEIYTRNLHDTGCYTQQVLWMRLFLETTDLRNMELQLKDLLQLIRLANGAVLYLLNPLPRNQIENTFVSSLRILLEIFCMHFIFSIISYRIDI